MRDSISLMRAVTSHTGELVWCATELRHAVRRGSKAELEAELFYRCAVDAQRVANLIADHMAFEDLEFKLKLSDIYGKNAHD